MVFLSMVPVPVVNWALEADDPPSVLASGQMSLLFISSGRHLSSHIITGHQVSTAQ